MPSGAHTIHTRIPRDYPWSPCPPHLCAPGATFRGGPAQPSGIPETCHSDGIDGTHLGLPSAAAHRRTHRGNSCSQRPSTEKMQTPRNAREGKCCLPAVPHGERASGNPSQIFHASRVLKGLQLFRAQLDSESSRSSVGGQWFCNVHKLGRNSEFIPGPSQASRHLSASWCVTPQNGEGGKHKQT